MDNTRWTVEQLESMKTNDLAELVANLVLLLRSMPDVPACNLQAQQELTPRQQEVKAMASELGFDLLNGPAYFVLCDWGQGIIERFEDNETGYELALVWMKTMAQAGPETCPICSNCDERTRGRCSKCGEGLCFDCNELLNQQDEPSGNSQDDGMCWKCREIKAGTYIGEDREQLQQEWKKFISVREA